MFAYELMAKAAAEPKKYEGKKYRVNGICCISPDAKEIYSEIVVDPDGCLQGKDCANWNWAYINSHTKVEEMKPEPKPVDFITAARSGKEIKPVTINFDYHPLLWWMERMTDNNKVRYVFGNWLIKDEE